MAAQILAGKERRVGPHAQLLLHLKPSAGDTALSQSQVGGHVFLPKGKGAHMKLPVASQGMNSSTGYSGTCMNLTLFVQSLPGNLPLLLLSSHWVSPF